ncbi:hypothetical protein JTB14_016118 [Gonioctena quinquepunctata]|nr:hypothetical protein JTB14_016118 [Gonioctena quinquepunctata]
MTIEEVKKEIIESLPDTIEEDELELKFKFGARDRSFDHWVAEASPLVRKLLLERGRVYLDWNFCVVKDHVRISRCFECQKFGHIQTACKSEVACSHCADKHETRECPNKDGPKKCINCIRAKGRDIAHDSGSLKC